MKNVGFCVGEPRAHAELAGKTKPGANYAENE